MTQQVTLTALRSMLSEQVNEVFLKIVKIEHPDLTEPVLLVNDRKDLVRADGTYLAFGFKFALPAQEDENVSTVNMIVPIVDQSIVTALRAPNTPFTVTVSVVRLASPDTVETGPYVFESQGIDFDRTTATITLAFNRDMFEDAYPKGLFSPSNR